LTIEIWAGVKVPVNLKVTIEKTNGILKLEALPKKQVQGWLLKPLETRRGLVTVIGVGVILLLLAIWLVQLLAKKFPEKAQQLYVKAKLAVFWNPIIRAYLIACLNLDTQAVEGIRNLYLYIKTTTPPPSPAPDRNL